MAIVETSTGRNLPCDTPNDAHALKDDWAACKREGVMLRVENAGKSEYVNPDHIVGITDGTND
jgi:hypothetical protein